MKILIDSYNECFQNSSGGVRTKINYHTKYLSKKYDIKLFDKWNDKISDYDILHVFKPGIQHIGEIKIAKQYGLSIVVSSTVTIENYMSILYKKVTSTIPHLRTHYGYMKEVFSIADAIIAETNEECIYLQKAFNIPKAKIFVVPNGICIDYNAKCEGLFSEKYNIRPGYVLHVGRFDNNKNQLSIIKALNNSNLEVVLIGGPDNNDSSYYDMCKSAAQKNIHFVGWINHDDPLLISAYQGCSTFILPSYKETFGIVALEAASCGANLAYSNSLPIKEWGLTTNCFSFSPNNVQEIREEVLHSTSKGKSESLKNEVIKRFSWESISNKIADIYEGTRKQ